MAHKGPELYLEPRISNVAAHLYIWSTMVTSMLVHTYVGDSQYQSIGGVLLLVVMNKNM